MCLRQEGVNIDRKILVVDHLASTKFSGYKVEASPTLTSSRAKCGGFYLTRLERTMRLSEMAHLQVCPARLWGWWLFMSKGAMGHAIGNAMSVNVLQRTIPRALMAAGFHDSLNDPWASKGYNPFA